jgi:sugar/nucleoside kinase (ribokinase family)
MTRDIDVVIAGHACLDIIPSFPTIEPMKPEEVFRPGRLVNIDKAAISLGGPVSNTGIGMVKLGVNVYFVTRLVDDIFGRLTLELMKKSANTEGVKVIEGESSSYTLVIAPPGIDRIFFHSPGTNNTFSSDDINPELCRRAKIFHLGYPPLMRTLYENHGKELIELYKKVKETGVVTSLDMSLPDPNVPSGKLNWRNVLERLLPYVDLYLPSAEESLFMVDREKYEMMNSTPGDILDKLDWDDYTKLSGKLLEWGAKIVALKSGHMGFYCRTASREKLAELSTPPENIDDWADREIMVPAFKVEKVASATGSGDSSIAGFLTAYLKGESFERALRYAVSLGYQNLHALDATSSIRDWEYSTEIVDNINQPQLLFKLNSKGWKFSPRKKMWLGHNEKD